MLMVHYWCIIVYSHCPCKLCGQRFGELYVMKKANKSLTPEYVFVPTR